MMYCRECKMFALNILGNGVCIRTYETRNYSDAIGCKEFKQNPKLFRGQTMLGMF